LPSTLALANPALLPKHPGYPASGNANDQGQTNATGEKALSAAAAVALARLGGALADSTLIDAASAHPQDNPEFQQLVQNALIHRAPDSSEPVPPVSWALAEGSAP